MGIRVPKVESWLHQELACFHARHRRGELHSQVVSQHIIADADMGLQTPPRTTLTCGVTHVLDFLWALSTDDFASEHVLHEVDLSRLLTRDAWEVLASHRTPMGPLGGYDSRGPLALQDLTLQAGLWIARLVL